MKVKSCGSEQLAAWLYQWRYSRLNDWQTDAVNKLVTHWRADRLTVWMIWFSIWWNKERRAAIDHWSGSKMVVSWLKSSSRWIFPQKPSCFLLQWQLSVLRSANNSSISFNYRIQNVNTFYIKTCIGLTAYWIHVGVTIQYFLIFCDAVSKAIYCSTGLCCLCLH